MRARLLGVGMGDVELEYGICSRAHELMARADVVLVNNKVFGEKREHPLPSFNCPRG